MSKERLEEIKRQFNIIKSNLIRLDRDTNATDDYEWLIKQAERVQELESESYNAHLERLLDRKEQQNKRYREAREIIEQVYKESYVRNAYGYEDGYLDGLDTAINIIDEALEVEK